jgi:hypothetical protein
MKFLAGIFFNYTTMQCFKNALAYSSLAVSYMHKIFMKLTPGANLIKRVTAIIDKFS